jgi:Cu2+-exporting ATPase
MLLGHWIEMRSLAQTTSALDSLAALLPDEAERSSATTSRWSLPPTCGRRRTGPPRRRVPADATVVPGSAEVDESMITGESRAVARTVGDPVVAGTSRPDGARG